jgi:hypothetical protein
MEEQMVNQEIQEVDRAAQVPLEDLEDEDEEEPPVM